MTRRIFVGLLIAAMGAAGVAGYEHFNVNDPPPTTKSPAQPTMRSEPRGVGFIELSRIIEVHPDGEKLYDLEETERLIRLELKNTMRPIVVKEPEVDAKPFDDSVWQKNAQTIVSEVAEIERRKKKAAEDYQKATEAEYLKKRDDINNSFLNEILNIKLKLQNAKVMRLTEDEMNELEARLEELQRERGKIQMDLQQQWIDEIAAHAEESIKDDVEKLRAQARESMERVKSEAEAAREAAQARDRAATERAQIAIERHEQRLRLESELEETMAAHSELEQKIVANIVDEAARLAYVRGLDVVMLKRSVEDGEKFYPFDFYDGLWVDLLKTPDKLGAAIFSTSTSTDLTDDLINAMSRRKRSVGSDDIRSSDIE